LQGAAGGESEGGGGFVGECGGVAGRVELGDDAAAGEDGVPGELPGTVVGPFVAACAGLLLLVTALAALLVPAAQYVLANDYQHTAPLNIESLRCGEPEPLWLLAQSVPSASLVPCVRTLPAGWTVATAKAKNGLSEFTLAHDPDSQAVVIRLTAACTTSGAAQRPSGQPGVRRYERADATGSGQITRYTVFTGGCVTAQLRPAGNSAAFADQASSVLGFTTRRSLQQALAARSNGRLHLDP